MERRGRWRIGLYGILGEQQDISASQTGGRGEIGKGGTHSKVT